MTRPGFEEYANTPSPYGTFYAEAHAGAPAPSSPAAGFVLGARSATKFASQVASSIATRAAIAKPVLVAVGSQSPFPGSPLDRAAPSSPSSSAGLSTPAIAAVVAAVALGGFLVLRGRR